ncbi:uncharacterized protein LOC130625770 [Hydractinia symbiolongicarpus]|uniref:uncharacterized protein LOC130625770 n=1 Tax=Hydractinia symbiolongicarpus TaxID=13093 RepID=UPI00254DCBFC|nr:uncharacterized protein LOC130625770 [Hydractinia symbiolongicarpus]
MSSASSCSNNHGKTVLSYFSVTISAVLLVTTATLNALILLVFIRNKKLLQKSVFYKLLLNITIADFLTAIVSDTVSVYGHVKEALHKAILQPDIYITHFGLFAINGVSILTMSLLCIDRIVALLKPLKYRKGLNVWQSSLMISSTWILSNLLVIPYFKIGYIRYLAIFSYFTVVITALSLVFAAMVYKRYFGSSKLPTHSVTMEVTKPDRAARYYPTEEKMENVDIKLDIYNSNGSIPQNTTRDRQWKHKQMKYENPTGNSTACVDLRKLRASSLSEQRVNKSFIILLVVFLVTYSPSVVMTAYMNLCRDCNCMFIHTLRDVTYLSILSSALWRPLNFILRLKTINKEVRNILRCT